MKLAETARTISAYARGLELAGAERTAAHLEVLAAFLAETPNKTMADLAECSPAPLEQDVATPGLDADGPTVADVTPHLEALTRTLSAGRAHAALTRDIRLLIDLLRRGNSDLIDSRYLSPMLNILRRALAPRDPEKRVREFADRLKAETGSDRFEDVFAELARSKLTREEVVEVATAVFGRLPKRTSRKAALSHIRKPHDAYMSAKRGIEATGGRSAA